MRELRLLVEVGFLAGVDHENGTYLIMWLIKKRKKKEKLVMSAEQ